MIPRTKPRMGRPRKTAREIDPKSPCNDSLGLVLVRQRLFDLFDERLCHTTKKKIVNMRRPT